MKKIYFLILSSVLIASSIYLYPSPLEFPLDDAYIHLVYAENLSENGGLFFNFPDEKGVGSSSLLWVLILAAGNWAGVSMHWVAKLVGLASLAVLGIGLYHLLRPLLPTWAALAAALLVILSGHMLWFALSGMETVLFLALGILSLVCYRQERWGWLGAALGLLVITRLEGIILALVIGGVDIWRRRAVRPGLLVAGLMCSLVCCPWIAYLRLRSGFFLPTSGIGRHYSTQIAIRVLTERSGSLAWLNQLPGIVFPLMWVGYSIEFILGGFALPAPYLYINPGLGLFNYRLSIWAVIGLGAVILPLLWISFRQLVLYLKQPGWKKDAAPLPLVIFLIWAILHNLCYMIYLPNIGSASRYVSLNHVALWLALALGIWHIRRSRYAIWLAAGLCVIALANTGYWNRVYDANIEHMQKVRIAAADHIRQNSTSNETCAAFDIGALRYYIRRPLIDLCGLVDPDLIHWLEQGRFDAYLIENKVSCLAVPGRANTLEDGDYDFIKESRLNQSSLFKLQEKRFFQIDRERWLVGYMPTKNYQATVTIYNLIDSSTDKATIR